MSHYDCSKCGEYGCLGECETKTPTTPPKASPVKSDGGSSNYYEIEIRTRDGRVFTCQTGDIIRALVGNDFTLGNIVKASRRISEALQGRGKEGTPIDYDLNKIIYFAQEIKDYVHHHFGNKPIN